jgi:outer membrane protein TolC
MKKLLFVLSSFVLWQHADAQTGGWQSFTLQEAINYALQNNVKVKNAIADEKIAKARNWEIITTGLPQISAEAGFQYFFKRPVSPALSEIFSDTTSATNKVFGYLASQNPAIGGILAQSAIDSKDQEISFVLKNNFSSNLTVSQLIFDGRYFIGIKATKDFTRSAALQKQLSDIDVKYNVAKAYYQAATAQESKGLLSENLKLVEKLLNDTREVYKEGLIEELDVNRLELVQSQLQSQINLQNQLAQVALDNLKFQMGLPLADEILLKDDINTLKTSIGVDNNSTLDVTQRSEYELLQTAIRIRGYDVAQRRSGYFPSLFGFLNYGWQAQSNNFGDLFRSKTTTYPDGDTRTRNQWFDQGLVGITLRIPIFDAGQKMANVKQAKLEQQKTMNDFENFKNAAELQFRASKSSFTAALFDEANNQRAVSLSEKIFKINQIKYKEGIGNSFELVQSETEFTTNQLKYMQSVLNLLNSKADLDKALGIK